MCCFLYPFHYQSRVRLVMFFIFSKEGKTGGCATRQGMDIGLMPLREKIHNFHKNASIFKIKVTFLVWDKCSHDRTML